MEPLELVRIYGYILKSEWRENMAIFRKRGNIPKCGRKRDNESRTKDLVPHNSFYVPGSGKKYKDYLESPENRRVAGISIRNN